MLPGSPRSNEEPHFRHVSLGTVWSWVVTESSDRPDTWLAAAYHANVMMCLSSPDTKYKKGLISEPLMGNCNETRLWTTDLCA